jgi:hypothetical protein
MTLPLPELPEIQYAGSPVSPGVPKKPLHPRKKLVHIGQERMVNNAEAAMERSIAIGQANAITKEQNKALELRRRAREKAIAYELERASNNPMENAKRFVRQ